MVVKFNLQYELWLHASQVRKSRKSKGIIEIKKRLISFIQFLILTVRVWTWHYDDKCIGDDINRYLGTANQGPFGIF